MNIRNLLALSLSAALIFGGPCVAEEYGTASRTENFDNPTSEGTKVLKSLVIYPTKTGSKLLAKAPKDGFKVLVFLHGRGGPAGVYSPLGKSFAKQGYIVVLSDTALRDPRKQVQDGKALFKALSIVNKSPGSFWQGSLNMKKVGLSGHSMGGGSTAHILADNPGYSAGFCFAPWQGSARFVGNASRIKAPIGIVHGKGDKVLRWNSTGKRLYDALSKDCDRFLYLMDESVNHYNVALNIPFRKKSDKTIYLSTEKLCLAFFDKHLKNKSDALTSLLKEQNGDKHLVKLYRGLGQATPKVDQPKPKAKGKKR
ncbi:MAG: hypothetical protein P1V97_33080, partial [Planctomycetota bacterium]|nr:hypothetical protein [Planctomycetota bacterium]